jgi:hypothetical protein
MKRSLSKRRVIMKPWLNCPIISPCGRKNKQSKSHHRIISSLLSKL